jgi:TnpA family transposase
MLSPRDTAYPVLKPNPSDRDLKDLFTPNLWELAFAEERTREAAPSVGLLLLLKTFQLLGYFVRFDAIPESVVRHISKTAGYNTVPAGLPAYDASNARNRHMAVVRSWLGVTPFGREARRVMIEASVQSSRVREDLADIINTAIEELVHQKFELPAFSALLRAARTARATVNRGFYARITNALSAAGKQRFTALLTRQANERRTGWDKLKAEPGQPTVQRIKQFVAHLQWLEEQAGQEAPLTGIPRVKLNRFAAEGRALNAARMGLVTEQKRYAVMAALVLQQRARAYDDGADMFIRQLRKIHARAKRKLQDKQTEDSERATSLVQTLRDVAVAYQSEGSSDQRLGVIGALIGPAVDDLVRRCEEHIASATRNHLPLLLPFYRHPRTALFMLLEKLPLISTTQDKRVERAIRFVLANKDHRADMVTVAKDVDGEDGDPRTEPLLDLSFIPDAWWMLVTGLKSRTIVPLRVDRRWLELCVLSVVADELQASDLCIPAANKFRDYGQQLVSWPEYHRQVGTYGNQTGIAVEPKAFVKQLRSELEKVARATDDAFPQNRHVRIENGEPIVTPVSAKPVPEGFSRFEQLLKERLAHVEILDALADTEHWLNWTRFFGPLSGLDAKLKKARERYLLTVFCYGCNLGPVQTARSVRGIDRFKLAFINQRHITEANLNDAITVVVNAYAQFPLQRLWGSGKSASADGTKWDLYPQNLISEYHIRYGGYGGIGYYLVSDSYIALVSRFTTCGSWEGHYILDFLKENESDVRPDTIHADTQGQSTAIFGLAYLLGIQLMPRIRNWKDRNILRPSPSSKYEHIDALFTGSVDGDLIESMLPDMLRVAVSIRTGAILPSDILKRLDSHSRKNRLYFALRELGRVVRSMFLLRYLSDLDLRHIINTATTKSERFNKFVQWVAFGGDSVIAENVRDEQRKFIKYNHLIANLLAFHNVVAMTNALRRMESEGLEVRDEWMAEFSPFQTERINRFGHYAVNFNRTPASPIVNFRKPAQLETADPELKILVMPKRVGSPA